VQCSAVQCSVLLTVAKHAACYSNAPRWGTSSTVQFSAVQCIAVQCSTTKADGRSLLRLKGAYSSGDVMQGVQCSTVHHGVYCIQY
jgi:hypothetical protein